MTRRRTYLALCVVMVMMLATPVRADVVLDWNAFAATAIVTLGGQVPPRALIRLAMVHVAIYDAVNAIDGVPFEPYAGLPTVSRPDVRVGDRICAEHHIIRPYPTHIFGHGAE